ADELRMNGRLATGQAYDPGAQLVQLQEPPVERLEGNGRRVIVVFVAVAAAQIAAAGDDHLGEEGTKPQPLGDSESGRGRRGTNGRFGRSQGAAAHRPGERRGGASPARV